MKSIKIIGMAISLNLVLSLGSSASLAHQYFFGGDGNGNYNDYAGSADLTEAGSVGTITFHPTEGYVHFSGDDDTDYSKVYRLTSDAFSNLTDPAVLKLWFRTSNTTGQSDYSSIFASDNTTDNGFQINFYKNDLRIHNESTEITITALSNLSADEWHLVTVWRDTVHGENKIWLDTNDVITTTEALDFNVFKLGANRQNTRGFEGDISDVSIYSDDSWSDSQQENTFIAGPTVPEPATLSLISLMSATLLVANRYFRS